MVIGILIALQINTWNEQNKLNSEEQKILLSLRTELIENLVKFDSIYTYHIVRDSVLNRLIDLNPKIENFDSQDSLILKADWSWTFNPSILLKTLNLILYVLFLIISGKEQKKKELRTVLII